MSSEPSTEDVLAKMDALLKRHRPDTSSMSQVLEDIVPPAELAAVAKRRPEPDELIPTLTDVVVEEASAEDSIPVLTEVIEQPAAEALPEEGGFDETLRRVEDLLVEQLENRIAPQLSAAFDQALGELLESSRVYIRQAVHDTLARELRKQLDDTRAADHAEKR